MMRFRGFVNGNSLDTSIASLINTDYNQYDGYSDQDGDKLQQTHGKITSEVIVDPNQGHHNGRDRLNDGGAKMNEEIQHLINAIRSELRGKFGFNFNEALMLIRRAGVLKSLQENPIGLHDSAHQWAIIVLTKTNNIRILEEYYSKN